MVQTGMDAGCTQGGCQQGRHGGLARRTGHAHELHLLRRSRQGRAQLVGGGKAVRQGLEVRICLFDGHWFLLVTTMEQHPAQDHKDQCNQDAGQHTGRVQPDVGDLTAAARGIDLDRLIGHGREHTAQHGHTDVPDIPPGVHPHAEHQQKALQRILAEVGHLAHDVHGKALGKGRVAQTAQHRL